MSPASDPRSGSRKQAGRAGGRHLDGWAALFGVLAPPLAWSVQVWLSWAISEVPCEPRAGSGDVLGLPVEVAWVAVGLLTGGVSAIALAASVAVWRRFGPLVQDRGPASDGPVRFLAFLGMLSAALFLAVIVLGTTSPVFLSCP